MPSVHFELALIPDLVGELESHEEDEPCLEILRGRVARSRRLFFASAAASRFRCRSAARTMASS